MYEDGREIKTLGAQEIARGLWVECVLLQPRGGSHR
jgi:hypothetical protein